MACDSCGDAEYAMSVEKVHRLPDGSLVGTAGTAAVCIDVVRWLEAGGVGDAPKPGEDECFFLLILKPDGTIWRAESRFPAFQVLDGFAAIGSGAPFAMAAMEMGASPAQAVRVAIKYDTGSGGRVRSKSIPRRAGTPQ